MAALITPWVHEPLAAPPSYFDGLPQQWCSPSAVRPCVHRAPVNAGTYNARPRASLTPRRSLGQSTSGILTHHIGDGVRSVSVPPIPRTSWDVRVHDVSTRRPESVQQRQRPVALPLAAVKIGIPPSNIIGASFHSALDESGYVLPEGPAITPLDISPSTRKLYPTRTRLNAATSTYPVENLCTGHLSVPASHRQIQEPVARSVVESRDKEAPGTSAVLTVRSVLADVSPSAEQRSSATLQSDSGAGPLESSPQNSVWKRYFADERREQCFSRPLSSSRILTVDSRAGASESVGHGGNTATVNGTGLRAMPARRPSAGVRRYQAEPSQGATSLPLTAPNSARDDPGEGQSPSLALPLQDSEVVLRPPPLRQLVSKFGPPADDQQDIVPDESGESTEEARTSACRANVLEEAERSERLTSSILPEQGEVVLNSAQVEAIAVAAAAVEHAARPISLKKLHELRSFRQPPAAVCQVVDAVSTLLGCYEPTWSAVKRRLDSMLLHRLMSFSAMEAARCPSSRVRGFLEFLEAPAFCDGSLADKCPAVAPLAEWCLAVARLLLQLRATDSEVHTQAESNEEAAPHPTAQTTKGKGQTAPPDLGGLYVNPPLWELDDEALCCVEDLVIGRDGVGHITFHGQTDCRSLLTILPHILMVERGEIVVYPDAALKPEVGHGLNKPATVVLYGCMPKSQSCLTDSRARHRYKQRVAQMTEEKGAIFEDYDPDDGTWKFRVLHF
ncbi:NUP98A [Symbiodinium sp. CCMP2456]|nr:NUP98A [Symbiodinium sp. CCMP2456]